MLREKILPEIVERKRRLKDYTLNVWSAGCATGEEPYSIVIELLEAIPDALLWNIKVIASDTSLRCLEVASKGIYRQEKLRDVSEKYIAKYFKQIGEHYEMKDFVKRLVVFGYHNIRHGNGLTNMDIIFCRNVMIYFDIEEQRRLISKLAKVLNTGGYLFLGHAESLYGLTTDGEFKFLYWNKGTAYQKVK